MKKLLFLTFLPAILWMLFIFGFSKDTGETSSSLSLTITQRIIDVIDYKGQFDEAEYNRMVELLHAPVRKAAHMAEYAVLAVLICIPLLINICAHNIRLMSIRDIFLIVILICLLYAVTDEIHQLFVPGRSGKITDVIIDVIGACAGGSVFLGIYKFANTKIVLKCKQ